MRDTRRSHRSITTDPEEKADRRLAIYVVVTALTLGFISGCGARSAWADTCNSYEDCMEHPRKFYPGAGGGYDDGGGPSYLKAIAFKLDEISKKLDRNQGPFMSLADSYAKKSKTK